MKTLNLLKSAKKWIYYQSFLIQLIIKSGSMKLKEKIVHLTMEAELML